MRVFLSGPGVLLPKMWFKKPEALDSVAELAALMEGACKFTELSVLVGEVGMGADSSDEFVTTDNRWEESSCF